MTNLKSKKILLCVFLGVVAIVGIALFSINSNSADAARSPEVPSAESHGVVFMVSAEVRGESKLGELIIEPTTQPAQEAAGRSDIVANFQARTIGNSKLEDFYNITVTVGGVDAAKVQGKEATVYIQHHSDKNEVQKGVFNNAGSFSFHLDELSVFTVCGTFNGGGGSGQDSGDTSPKTGLYE